LQNKAAETAAVRTYVAQNYNMSSELFYMPFVYDRSVLFSYVVCGWTFQLRRVNASGQCARCDCRALTELFLDVIHRALVNRKFHDEAARGRYGPKITPYKHESSPL
jgi:hypothetical protein